MKKITFFFLLVFSISCTDLDTLVAEIAKENIMESEYVGLSGVKSSQYQNFQKLKLIATDEELVNLKTHKNSVVRTYVYLSLIDRARIKPSAAFAEALAYNEHFSKTSACQILSSDVCTEIYFKELNSSQGSTKEMVKMDSLILSNMEGDHLLLYMALNGKKQEEKHDERIKSLALDHHNASAIFYLVENKVAVDSSKLKESIQAIITKGGIGTEPAEELQQIFDSLNNKHTDCDTVFEFGEELPVFKGGDMALLKYNMAKIIPIIGEANKRTGNLIARLYYSLIISKEGKVVEADILSNVDTQLEKKLISALKNMPDWIPGKVDGQYECMKITYPISCIKWE